MVLALLLSGCAHRDEQEIRTIYDTKWFSASKEHRLEDEDSRPLPHLFFDVDPHFVSSDRSANVIISTPYRSSHAYGMDILSGQRHYIHSYCEQKDVWKKDGGTTSRPDFSIGYIPRVLDQLGDPHKVIVIGNVKRERSMLDLNYVRVRMIGAYVEQVCMEGDCLNKNTWLSRLVFVAVDSFDDSYDKVSSLEDLKKHVNWERIKTQIENIDGRNPLGNYVSPAIRVRPLISYDEAFSYFKKRSIYFTPEELTKIQKSCHTLYDKFWKDVGEQRPEDIIANTEQELSDKLKIREALKARKLPVDFSSRLRIFTREYYDEMKTCGKFVYAGNINENAEKFWFLSYMGMFYRLHNDGYYFDCARNKWESNYLDQKGKPYYNPAVDIGTCSNKSIDLAMKELPGFIRQLNTTLTRKYRFIDYDMHPFGTHRKLYSWTKYKLGRFECNEDPNVEIQSKIPVSPEEHPWKNRDMRDKTKIDSEIIY